MQARTLPARHGVLWLIAGFRLFRNNPPLLTALALGYLFLVVCLNLLPLIGPFLLPLALPALAVIVANGCRLVEGGRAGRALAAGMFTHGLRGQGAPLLRLGGLHLLGSLAILGIGMAMEGGSSPTSLAGLDPGNPEEGEKVLAAMLRLLVIAMPAIMAFWFAPLLTAWDGVAPMKSVFFSFVASWRNWRAFAAYGLAVALVAVVVPGLLLIAAGLISQPLVQALSVALRMVMVFVGAPVMMASVYLSYRDVFHSPQVNDEA
ncbi:MAG: BPSS1780 family membrane protein [Candidatus Nitricoxidivorans perseverans]|uniref:BPSS1780 family membrane protein n=1 Tax=Candidatus Nitricoxidivorans perseverans TaxID=2975601 RepID=A0AA49FJ54_9PROT|nr:MAG: BPSS1780 family membrane protein [Candidatus Nitricoxidivorans perseverans]